MDITKDKMARLDCTSFPFERVQFADRIKLRRHWPQHFYPRDQKLRHFSTAATFRTSLQQRGLNWHTYRQCKDGSIVDWGQRSQAIGSILFAPFTYDDRSFIHYYHCIFDGLSENWIDRETITKVRGQMTTYVLTGIVCHMHTQPLSRYTVSPTL